jgi:transposase-like protein
MDNMVARETAFLVLTVLSLTVAKVNINLLLILAGFATMIEICQVKYLNNIIEQDHRFIKKINALFTF